MRRRMRRRRRRKKGEGREGTWALGLLYPEKSLCLTHPPFWDHCDPFWQQNYTRAGGEALSAPPALGPAAAPGASHTKLLQDGACRTNFHNLFPHPARGLCPGALPTAQQPQLSLPWILPVLPLHTPLLSLAQALLPCAKVNMATAQW